MKLNKAQIRNKVEAEIKKGNYKNVEYSQMVGMSSNTLSQFLRGHIEYVPPQILKYLGLKMNNVEITYSKAE